MTARTERDAHSLLSESGKHRLDSAARTHIPRDRSDRVPSALCVPAFIVAVLAVCWLVSCAARALA